MALGPGPTTVAWALVEVDHILDQANATRNLLLHLKPDDALPDPTRHYLRKTVLASIGMCEDVRAAIDSDPELKQRVPTVEWTPPDRGVKRICGNCKKDPFRDYPPYIKADEPPLGSASGSACKDP